MKMTTTRAREIVLAIAAMSAAGCASVPEKNPAVEQARAAYAAAASDPQVAQNAAVELNRAERALEETERLWKDRAEQAQIEHNAYLATQRSKIARETSQLRAAEQAVTTTSSERDRVLLQARTREAEAARNRADAKSQDAEQSRLIAEARAREAQAARDQALEQSREAQTARELAAAQTAEALAAKQRAEEMQQRAKELESQLSELKAKQTERGLVLTLSDVLFDTGKSELRPGASRAIDQLSKFLNEYPERSAMIEGFTDSVGAENYNQGLSERRANAVRAALVTAGIDPGRINVRGFGEAFPVVSNSTPGGRQQNRRVEIVISDEKGKIPERTASGAPAS